MRPKFSVVLTALLITIILLVALEVFSTTLIPVLGFQNLKLNFNILFILFLCLYVDTPYLAIIILIIQSFHAAFTIEGWAYGTLTGVIISLVIGQLKEILQFTGAWTTILVTFVFQYLWFVTISVLLYFRLNNFPVLSERFWHFVPESIILAFCSPFLFQLLRKIWKSSTRESSGEQVNV